MTPFTLLLSMYGAVGISILGFGYAYKLFRDYRRKHTRPKQLSFDQQITARRSGAGHVVTR